MAYELGRRELLDREEFDSYAYGITLPVKRGENGYFQQSFISSEQAASNLRNLLSTRKGERIMQPEFGTGLHSLLFEQIDENLEQNIQREITQAVSFWLPYITIETIEVNIPNEFKDVNLANLRISFGVGNNIELEEITFTITE